jgi:hypothetical protein
MVANLDSRDASVANCSLHFPTSPGTKKKAPHTRLEETSMPLKLRAAFLVAFALTLVTQVGHSQEGKDPIHARMKKDLFFLASDECEGRGVGTIGLDLAAYYIAAQFKKAGLQPGGLDKTYFQPFPFATGSALDGDSTLIITGPKDEKFELKQGQDFQVVGTSAPGKVNAPLVFAGYGVTSNKTAYDDFAGIDVKGKVIVTLRRLPRFNLQQPFDGSSKDDLNALAAIENKQNGAEAHRAAAVILVNDASELPNDGLTSFQATKQISTLSTPYVHVKRAVIDDIIKKSTGMGLTETEKAIDNDLKPRSAALTGWNIQLNVRVKRNESPVKNVIGVIPGKGNLANETVVVGSHYDHLGAGFFKTDGKTIYYGADDNGSGTTCMMELARRFAAKNNDGRRMVFMAFTAEERGLIGSRHYCRVQPLFPLKDTVAMFNLDMVGRYDPRITKIDDKSITLNYGDGKGINYPFMPEVKVFRQVKDKKEPIEEGTKADVFKNIPAKGLSAAITTDGKYRVASITLNESVPLLVEGFNSAKEFDALVDKMNPGFDIVKKNSRGFFASDQYSFYQQKVPVLFFWTGEHPEYHKITDTPDKINIQGMKRIVEYAERVIDHLRTEPKRPEYTVVPIKFGGGGGGVPTSAPSLRFQPDPTFDGKGVLVDKIVPSGPADKAGMKEGDVIIEIAGKAITNVASYNTVRATLKADVAIDVRVIRDKREITLKVTPVLLK